ncbi:MAG: hypothetical protein ABIO44_08275 [Saprospiraceae bacterium]
MKHLPLINLSYWILIIIANTIGETAGDLISQTFELGYGAGTLVLFLILTILVIMSIYSKVQILLLYWAIIILTSTTGTTISDFLSRTFSVEYLGVSQEIGYIYASIFLFFVLIFTLGFWKWYSNVSTTEAGLSKSTEFLYWMTILTSSTLGTAFGDVLGHDTPLGFDGGTLLLLGFLGVLVIIVYLTNISREILYWFAIIIIHPIGATMGDYFTKPEGLDLGNVNATLILALLLCLVIGIEKQARQELLK